MSAQSVKSVTAQVTHQGLWSNLIGHDDVLPQLIRAARAAGGTLDEPSIAAMTHAWLFTGPPGSGRSVAALALAGALECVDAGCGTCSSCELAAAGNHPDIEHVVPTAVMYRAEEVRALVARAAMLPMLGSWRVIVVEDADRLNESSANALLKAIEEPAPRTVWMLCAPSAVDVLPTIASRCRLVHMGTPPVDVVAAELIRRYTVDESTAVWAARAAQGHVGRAAALVRDEHTRSRRASVMAIPGRLTDLVSCYQAATTVVATAQADAAAVTTELDEREEQAVLEAYGDGATGKGLSAASVRARSELTRLKKQQESRARRVLRDEYDRVLLDLLGFYRDVWMSQSAVSAPLINTDMTDSVTRLADRSRAEESVAKMDAITHAQSMLRANAAPLLVFESLFVQLWNPGATRLAVSPQ